MQKKEETGNHKKRPYETPRLRTIELESEQVLAEGCKFTDNGSDVGSPTNCIDNGCLETGT